MRINIEMFYSWQLFENSKSMEEMGQKKEWKWAVNITEFIKEEGQAIVV